MNLHLKIFQWDDVIHPQLLIGSNVTHDDLQNLQKGFLNQLQKDVGCLFSDSDFSKRRVLSKIRQLVNLSNTIYGYLFRLSPGWKRKVSSSPLRKVYLHLLISIERALDKVQQIEPETYSKIPLTLYGISVLKMEIKKNTKRFSNFLEQLSSENRKLYKVLYRDLYLFLNKKDITQSEIDYATNLIWEIGTINVFDNMKLVEVLYIEGFNTKKFFSYYTNEINSRLKAIPDLHDQLQAIIDEKDRFNGLPDSKSRMFSNLSPIADQFNAYLNQKENHIKQVISLRNSIVQQDQNSKSSNRLKIFLSVPQLSLFIRLLMEKGLLAKENIGELFTFFATHFSTPQTAYISAESLRKKSTDVEFATAQKLKAHLIGMLNWLNENYNLSNYKA